MDTSQGTVARFDPQTSTGTVLLDDGTEVGFPPPAFARSGLRLLRSGQRVTLAYSEDGTVSQINIVTFQ